MKLSLLLLHLLHILLTIQNHQITTITKIIQDKIIRLKSVIVQIEIQTTTIIITIITITIRIEIQIKIIMITMNHPKTKRIKTMTNQLRLLLHLMQISKQMNKKTTAKVV